MMWHSLWPNVHNNLNFKLKKKNKNESKKQLCVLQNAKMSCVHIKQDKETMLKYLYKFKLA